MQVCNEFGVTVEANVNKLAKTVVVASKRDLARHVFYRYIIMKIIGLNTN